MIEKLFHDSGWVTIPVYRFKYDPQNQEEIAPSLIGADNLRIVLPDILIYKGNSQRWIECKHEEGASWTYTKSIFEHGFARRLYESYLKVEEITKIPVWIVFHEVNQLKRSLKDHKSTKETKFETPSISEVANYPRNMLRGRQLSQLPNIRHSLMNRKPYIYFPQQDLFELGTIENPNFRKLEE